MVELRLDPRVRGRVDASDVLQEASLEAFQRLEEYLRNPKRLVRIDGAELEGYTPKVISFLKSWYQREKENLVWDPERKHFRLRKS